jgi:hypothetical protein
LFRRDTVTRERGSSGQQFDRKTFDPSAVQPGSTTREEVLARFSMINTGYKDPHLFWGRWAKSQWGYWWMVIAPSPNGGGGAGAGDVKRIWHVHNMLITFDENGVATGKQLLDDEPQLYRELNRHAATLTPIDAGEIISLDGEPRIALTREWVEAVRTGRKISTIRVIPDKIIRIAHTGANDKSNNPGRSCHILYLSEKTAFGNKLRFCSEGPALVATLRYLHRYGSPNMQWE